MSANADLTTVETYAHKGKQIKPGFSYIWAKIFKKKLYFAYLRGPVGGLQ